MPGKSAKHALVVASTLSPRHQAIENDINHFIEIILNPLFAFLNEPVKLESPQGMANSRGCQWNIIKAKKYAVKELFSNLSNSIPAALFKPQGTCQY
jgi:hypothetical protein